MPAAENSLPGELTTFVGRRKELAELRPLLAANRLLTMTGPGGCGKSRLALRLAADGAAASPDGAWWVDLAPLSNPRLVPGATLAALGLPEDPTRGHLARLVSHLRERRCLVVLDNCEHLIDGCVEVVDELLRRCPGVSLVATSRESLRVSGEVVYVVPPLAYPGYERTETELLSECDSVRLFLDRARIGGFDSGLTDDDLALVAEICRRLDGVPLAIELAAARNRGLGLAQIAAGLDDRFRLLSRGTRSAPARQRTLEASVGWSHALLNDVEKTLFRRLSPFVGGFTLTAAETVCVGDGVHAGAVLDLLTQLVEKSLVIADRRGRDVRYCLLETIRQYADERLAEAGEFDAVQALHTSFYGCLAEQLESEVERAPHAGALDELETEHANVRAVLERAINADDAETALWLVGALALFWQHRAHCREGLEWFDRALGLAGGPPASRARAEWGRGHVAIYASDYDIGVSSALKAFELASEMGDRAVVARALKDLGLVESYVDPVTGRAKVGEAVSLARASGDIWCLADGLQISAWAAVFQGDVDAAYALLLEANAMAEAMGNRYLIAWHGASAGMIQLLWGDLPNAETLLQNALSAAVEVGEPTTYATAVSQLVELDAVRGAFATAHEEATRAFEHLGNLHGLLAVESVEAAVVSCLLAEGRVVEARERSLSLLPAARASSMLFAVASGAILVGRILLEDNDIDGARDAAGEAAQVAEALGNRWLAASADDVSARIAARTGEIEVAEELHRRALAARVAARFRLAIIDSLEALGWAAVVQRRHAEGVRILGAAEAARESIGYRRFPLDQPGHDAAVAAAEEAMGSADFGSVWAEGATLSLDAVVAYLSRARGQRRRPSMGWASLTPTELDVVRLVAEGLTNPEIGRRLFIAPGTVKTHLAHVFAKLDVANRAALAAQVARRTL